MSAFARVIAIGLLFFAMLSAAVSAAERLDDKPRIAVVSAFPPEWVALQTDLSDRTEHEINGRQFITGKLAGKDVVLFLSGVSMVNAAMTMQVALDRFVVTSVVFSGIAGGVDPALSIGDVVVADQWGEYLEAVFARKVGDGYEIPPFIPKDQFAGYGMIVPRSVTVARKGGEETKFWFPSDPALLEAARKVAARLDLQACAPENRCLTKPPKIIVGGNGVSGQAFVDNAEFRDYVHKTFEAKVLDMESAAVAHVTYSNGVPFVAVRSLSDLAGGGEGANQMATFMALASTNSASVVKALLAEMP
ncbi:MAG: 5'-methylthioadenosine/S-adenosylhomocysteine nucleosidase [Aquamicrobium sp.]|uniref:5'-methylthioadenosine/S-adenosylhomocysteine nucleosidase n=1 Tax=Mesorhizobium sp. Pch-S TaxID=2082387 RepID=UPI001012081D|nr:5'-methylthioadenosine/S-adenosylhomocysteine nucleosidase [Mesorhizobium sp. Pch-S]MBR2688786.1 5'-methylthioadenosine/S-adenosylhomocysteine nucleosidase [Aquamicrobium sp.]QAZ45729.1 phosphorylase [Mesorhizobium sp. Pch-S]